MYTTINVRARSVKIEHMVDGLVCSWGGGGCFPEEMDE